MSEGAARPRSCGGSNCCLFTSVSITSRSSGILDNPDTARSLLKSLFRIDASLHSDEQAGMLTVRLLHQPTRAEDLALAPLLDELNRIRTIFPGTHLRLANKVLSEHESSFPNASQAGPDGRQPGHPECKGVTNSDPEQS